MKAIILNSGMGSRMGSLTAEQPKCMTKISANETILSRQLKMLADFEIEDVIITTGKFAEELMEYCESLDLPLNYTFIYNKRQNRGKDWYELYD